MRRGAAVLVLTLAAVAGGQTNAGEVDDLAFVLGRALYPVQVMAYCSGEVAAEPDFLAAGEGWNARNWQLLANLEERGTAAGVSVEVRRAADEEALAEIASLVAGQGDRLAYCRLLANVIEAGYYDIDRRDDLTPALKRIFGDE